MHAMPRRAAGGRGDEARTTWHPMMAMSTSNSRRSAFSVYQELQQGQSHAKNEEVCKLTVDTGMQRLHEMHNIPLNILIL